MIKTSTPEQVADAIVGALDALNRSTVLWPRNAQSWFLRATKADRLLADAAHSPARAAYERRAAGR